MRLDNLDFTISDYVVKKTANYINVRSESFEDLDEKYYNTFKEYIDTLAHGEVYCVIGFNFPNARIEKLYDCGELNDKQVIKDKTVEKNIKYYRVEHKKDNYRGLYYPIFTNKDDLCNYIEKLIDNGEMTEYTILKKPIKEIYNEYVKNKTFNDKPVKGVVLNLYSDRVFLHGTLCRYINSDLKKEVWDEYLIKVGYYRNHKKKKEEEKKKGN